MNERTLLRLLLTIQACTVLATVLGAVLDFQLRLGYVALAACASAVLALTVFRFAVVCRGRRP